MAIDISYKHQIRIIEYIIDDNRYIKGKNYLKLNFPIEAYETLKFLIKNGYVVHDGFEIKLSFFSDVEWVSGEFYLTDFGKKYYENISLFDEL